MPKTLFALAIASASLFGVAVAASTLPEPQSYQRVWVEIDGQVVWEVVCREGLEPRACLQQSLASDLIGGVDAHTVRFEEVMATARGDFELRSALLGSN